MILQNFKDKSEIIIGIRAVKNENNIGSGWVVYNFEMQEAEEFFETIEDACNYCCEKLIREDMRK